MCPSETHANDTTPLDNLVSSFNPRTQDGATISPSIHSDEVSMTETDINEMMENVSLDGFDLLDQPYDNFEVPLKPGDTYLSREPDQRKRRVGFTHQVKVVVIPSHQDYSKSMKDQIWASRQEISRNAKRNLLEFSAEGYDWHNVALDEDMFAVEGERVHPIHGNPLLCSALQRQLPYPKARAVSEFDIDELMVDDEENGGAIISMNVCIERPSSPFLDFEEHDCGVHGLPDYLTERALRYQHLFGDAT